MMTAAEFHGNVDHLIPEAVRATYRWRYKFVHEYLTFLRWADATTAAGGRVKTDWAGEPMDAAAWRRAKTDALNARINLKMGLPPRWRKLDVDYQNNLKRDSRRITDYGRRIRHAGWNLLSCPELKRRFPHIDRPPRDE